MDGAQESTLFLIADNKWDGMTCRLDDTQELDIRTIIKHMRSADDQLIEVLRRVNDGDSPLLNYMVLAEHEAHHQGQIINLMYACD